MTNEEKTSLRQQAANIRAAINAIIPGSKNAAVALNFDAQQVSIQISSQDSSVSSGTGMETTSMVCKFADLPPAT